MKKLRTKNARLKIAVLFAVLVMSLPGSAGKPVLAWWGTIYPEFCFMGETSGTPRIHFWLIENLEKLLSVV